LTIEVTCELVLATNDACLSGQRDAVKALQTYSWNQQCEQMHSDKEKYGN